MRGFFVFLHFGWRRSVMWFGCVGCAAATLLLYCGPLAVEDSFWVATACAMLWGFLLSGFTSLPALLLSMGRPEDRGSAFAAYSLCAGLAAFAGPALYVAAAFMTHFLKSPADPQYRDDSGPAEAVPGDQAIKAAAVS
ncbi:hypothetical protein [Streptomyces coeruleorubidus]|uniref:hypothetical protein n=1 Tax=Streptomyces coeruleorubidus TaxID=116188 RepID=UPI0037BC9488